MTRRKKTGQGSVNAPQSLIGQFMCALTLRRKAERDQLASQLRQLGFPHSDEFAWTAFSVAVRQYFGTQKDMREIDAVVSDIRLAFGERVPTLEMKTMIQRALGDPEASIEDISGNKREVVTAVALIAISDFWGGDENKVNAVFVEAEATLRDRGIELAPAT
jgi:hypothetical protein